MACFLLDMVAFSVAVVYKCRKKEKENQNILWFWTSHQSDTDSAVN